MSIEKVRVALVGVGAWGQCHLEAYLSLPQVEVVALCDTRTDHLDSVADQFGIAERYDSADALWQRDDIDLVDVATAEAEHLAPVLGALNSGKHVLVEKPVSASVAEAQSMQQAAQDNNRYLMPGHILRFDPRYAEIRSSIQENRVGEVISIFSKRGRPKSQFKLYGRVHTAYVLMVHDIDLALWYAGSRVRSVRAYERSISGMSAPDLLWACLEFESGAIAVLQSSWLTPDQTHIEMADATEVIGSDGVLRVDTVADGFERWDETGRHPAGPHIHHRVAGRVVGALRDELGYLCDCIRNEEPPVYVPFADAIHGLEVIEAVVRSAQTGQDVQL
jgi:predicted dehydrogenase